MKKHFSQFTHRVGDKLQKLRYLNRGVVFSIDIVCSTVAACMAFVGVNTLYPGSASLRDIFFSLGAVVVVSTLVFLLFRFYKVIIRHSDIRNLPRIFIALLLISFIFYRVLPGMGYKQEILISLLYFIFACCLIVGIRVAMICVYEILTRCHQYGGGNRHIKKVFLYGNTTRCVALSDYINVTYRKRYNPVAFIDPESVSDAIIVRNMPVYGQRDMEKLEADLKAGMADAIIFTSSRDIQKERERVIEWVSGTNTELFLTPPLDSYSPGASFRIAPVEIKDLLERPEINIEEDRISQEITGKKVMVTGAAGSIGSELVRQLCKFSPAKLILIDNAETPLHLLRLEIEEAYPDICFHPIIADVRSKVRCDELIRQYDPSIIFHAAAYKHVPLMEENPCEAIITNVMGTIHVAEAARENAVEKFVMISTDKAVNPTNVMGATKRVAEMYVQSLDAHHKQTGSGSTRFITTRFGNVLGSNGSVVPRFREQIARGGPVTVTHPEIIRYFMTIPEACCLVLQAGAMGQGGEIFVFDMGDPVKIDHLARRMIQLSHLIPDEDIKIEYTGLRPGEKLYEEVLSSLESTTETSHNKIRVANAISNAFEDIRLAVRELIDRALAREIELTITALKALVPEFKSKNSPYEKYDK